MMWGGGWGWFGAVVAIACVALMAWMMLGHGMGHGGRGHEGAARGEPKESSSDPGRILAERFARGDISEEEFEHRRRVLESRPS